jgi:hypothetical protein
MVIRAAFASRSRDGSIPFQRVPNAALVPLASSAEGDPIAAADAELGGGEATLAS